jgi:hypothetical protein
MKPTRVHSELAPAALLLPLLALTVLAAGQHRLWDTLWQGASEGGPETPAPTPAPIPSGPTARTLPTVRIGDVEKTWLLRTVRETVGILQIGGAAPAPGALGEVPPVCRKEADWGLFVTLFAPTREPLRAVVQEKTLAEAALRAAQRLVAHPAWRARGYDRDHRVRIKIDILSELTPLPLEVREDFARPRLGPPLGVSVHRGEALSYLLPADAVYYGLQTQGDLLGEACVEAGLPVFAWTQPETAVSVLRTVSFVDRAPGSDRILDLVRATPLVGEVDRRKTVNACIYAGNYLVANQQSNGRFLWSYDAATDEASARGYDVAVHAGTCAALYELYGMTRLDQFKVAADRGIEFLVDAVFVDTRRPHVAYVADSRRSPSRVELGPSALAAVALLERRRVTDGDLRYHDLLEKLLAFALFMQEPNGRFRQFYDVEMDRRHDRPGGNARSRDPARAARALAAAAALLGKAEYRDGAERALDYLSRNRDLALDPEEDMIPPADSDYCLAARELAVALPRERHAEYAWSVAQSIARHLYEPPGAPAEDFLGGSSLSRPPRLAPSAANLEAFTSLVFLAEHWARHAEGWAERRRLARGWADAAARFVLAAQFVPENSYFVPNPTRALGGIRQRPTNARVRCTGMMHALSALVRMAALTAAASGEERHDP